MTPATSLLSIEADALCDLWLNESTIERGIVANDFNALYTLFVVFCADRVPVTRSLFGRMLSRRFLKRQAFRSPHTQFYFLNRQL